VITVNQLIAIVPKVMANYFFITQVIEAIFSELDNDGSPDFNEEVEESTIEISESSMESM